MSRKLIVFAGTRLLQLPLQRPDLPLRRRHAAHGAKIRLQQRRLLLLAEPGGVERRPLARRHALGLDGAALQVGVRKPELGKDGLSRVGLLSEPVKKWPMRRHAALAACRAVGLDGAACKVNMANLCWDCLHELMRCANHCLLLQQLVAINVDLQHATSI